MSIACMLGGTGERRTKTHARHDQSPTSVPMDGNATAEAFITRQWLPDFPKTPAHCGTGRTLAGKPLFNETIRYRRGWLLLVISPSPGAFRNRGSPQLARAVTAEISQNINSPRTGCSSLASSLA